MRKLVLLSAAVASIMCLAAGAPTAQAISANAAAIAALGADNPSGKLKSDGSPLTKSSDHTIPTPKASQSKLSAQEQEPECPTTVHCVFVPAAYQNNNPADPSDYGNYDEANRPVDSKINSIVIHDTEGDLESVLNAFQDPQFYVSAHYVIASDGTIYQMVRNKDIAWHAANWWYNQHSIGIEHVGHAALGSTEYTPAMYTASARLVKWLADKYDIPQDRQHIIGHDNVPGTSAGRIPTMHVDPGPFWNWQNYMVRAGIPLLPEGTSSHAPLVAVAPTWSLSKLPVTGCWPSDLPSCVPAGEHSTNFVYLRTAPESNAPFVTDPVLGQGSTQLANTAARAYYGQKFAVADRQVTIDGTWYQVWYAGQLAWFHSPWTAPAAVPANGKYVTPKAGLASVPLYGRPVPELAEYPADLNPPAGSIPAPTPLPYSLLSGQRYSVVDANPETDHYFSWTYDHQLPYDQTDFKGQTKYVEVQFNGRAYFVKKSDVTIAG